MLFVIPGIKCRRAQRRVVAFHLQSPNEKESISLTSANTSRHADKHWIFITHTPAVSLPNTHLSHSSRPRKSKPTLALSHTHSHTYCEINTYKQRHSWTQTHTLKGWCTCAENFMTLFSCGETLENSVFLAWMMKPHTDLFDANCRSTERLHGTSCIGPHSTSTCRPLISWCFPQRAQSVRPTAVQFCFFISHFTFTCHVPVCCTFGHGGTPKVRISALIWGLHCDASQDPACMYHYELFEVSSAHSIRICHECSLFAVYFFLSSPLLSLSYRNMLENIKNPFSHYNQYRVHWDICVLSSVCPCRVMS